MFKKPFSFEGRIRRLEYGLSIIIYLFFFYGSIFGAAFLGLSDMFGVVIAIIFIPAVWFLLAQAAKRCHDRGNSGWWQLIPFYGIVLLFGESDFGENDYGPNPKGEGNGSELNEIGNHNS